MRPYMLTVAHTFLDDHRVVEKGNYSRGTPRDSAEQATKPGEKMNV